MPETLAPHSKSSLSTTLKRSFVSQAARQKLNVNIAKVTHSVISHHHFDHGGGLLTFLKANHQAKVYLRNSSTEQFYFDIFGLIKRRIGLDETLFQLHLKGLSLSASFLKLHLMYSFLQRLTSSIQCQRATAIYSLALDLPKD